MIEVFGTMCDIAFGLFNVDFLVELSIQKNCLNIDLDNCRLRDSHERVIRATWRMLLRLY